VNYFSVGSIQKYSFVGVVARHENSFFTFNISDAQSSRIGNVLELLATLFAGWQGSARRKF